MVSSPSHSIQGFHIGQVIGEGGQATVKLGFNPMTGEHAAIKVLEKGPGLDIQAAKKEFKIHQSVSHQNIIKVFSCSEDKDHIYILMEYAAAGELFDKIG